MKILYVCHRFPFPPKRGGKIRPFNMIKHLGLNHQVTVASLVRSAEEESEGKGLAQYCHGFEAIRVRRLPQIARMVARLPTSSPSSMGYFFSPALAHRIKGLVESIRFDLIFVHCSSVAQYVAHIDGTPKILDFGDMDSQKWLEYAKYKPFPMSLGYWFEGKKLLLQEQCLAREFDLCTATTRAELETLNAYGLGVPADWFPNGVDTDYFVPHDADYKHDTICFVGRMDYYPNQECMFDFCTNTLPLIRKRIPSVKLLIVGADPSLGVKRLGNLPGVTVTGSVPDVRPFLHSAALMVAPLNIARGTQNKILEAMALGVPVVTSEIAAGGVDAVAGEHLLVCRGPQDYAEAICKVMQDSSERWRLSLAGRERMLSHHSWGRSMRRLDAIIERCLSARMRSPKKLVEGEIVA